MMDCSRVRAEDLAERYLLGRLDGPEQEAFEDHLVACADCSDELAGLSALQEELASSRDRIVAEAAASSRAPRRTWLLAAAAAIAALAAGLGLWVRLEPTSPPASTLAELAAFEPPAYAPARLRDIEDDAARSFDEAMARYSAGDYGSAINGLEQAAALDPDSAQISFYLGASSLLAGRTSDGIRALEHTVELGNSPYLEEALLLLAKAHLRSGGLRRARSELVRVIELDGDLSEQARSIINELDGGTQGRD
jgi:tetratricopeptide (TPR) repeat protein